MNYVVVLVVNSASLLVNYYWTGFLETWVFKDLGKEINEVLIVIHRQSTSHSYPIVCFSFIVYAQFYSKHLDTQCFATS